VTSLKTGIDTSFRTLNSATRVVSWQTTNKLQAETYTIIVYGTINNFYSNSVQFKLTVSVRPSNQIPVLMGISTS